MVGESRNRSRFMRRMPANPTVIKGSLRKTGLVKRLDIASAPAQISRRKIPSKIFFSMFIYAIRARKKKRDTALAVPLIVPLMTAGLKVRQIGLTVAGREIGFVVGAGVFGG